MSLSTEEIQALSAEERLRLISELWDSLADSPEDVPFTDAQRREIDRRLDRYERGLTQLHSWEEVRARIERDE
jgi:putative addiction module component (TIGR02574 family)